MDSGLLNYIPRNELEALGAADTKQLKPGLTEAKTTQPSDFL